MCIVFKRTDNFVTFLIKSELNFQENFKVQKFEYTQDAIKRYHTKNRTS